MKTELCLKFLKNSPVSNFMNIGPVGDQLDGQTDKHDEANSRFSQFYESFQKITAPYDKRP